jgi:PAS domain S-box-containing protein
MKSAGKTTEQLLEEIDALQAELAEHQRTERALRKSEEHYRSLIENIPIGIYRNTPGSQGKFLMANPAFLNMFGFNSEEELKEITVANLYLDPDERRVFSNTLLAQGSVTGVELLLKKKDGTPIWGLVTAQVVHTEDTAEATYLACTIQDITK